MFLNLYTFRGWQVGEWNFMFATESIDYFMNHFKRQFKFKYLRHRQSCFTTCDSTFDYPLIINGYANGKEIIINHFTNFVCIGKLVTCQYRIVFLFKTKHNFIKKQLSGKQKSNAVCCFFYDLKQVCVIIFQKATDISLLFQ